MKRLDGYRMRVVLVGFAAATVFGGRHAKADFTFGTPVNLGPTVNSVLDEWIECVSFDGLELYLGALENLGGDEDFSGVWVCTRETLDDAWNAPVNLGPTVNHIHRDEGACISPDGLELYFSSWGGANWGHFGGYGLFDIWVTRRVTKAADWGTPENLGPTINDSGFQMTPWVSADGLELYFSRFSNNNMDLWVAKRASISDPWDAATRLGSPVNTSAHEYTPSLSTDGLLLFFSEDDYAGRYRPGGFGRSDMWLAKRESLADPWGEPVNLGTGVNSPSSEWDPRISPDGRTLFFSSDRPGGHGEVDIWQAPILPVVDFTGDYRVDIEDLTILIEHWGQNEPAYDMGPTPFGDGVVDEADLEVLMSYWGQDIYDPHLLAHWKLDETEADVAHDSAGVNDTTIIGDATWEPENGKIDGALQLDGADDYIQTPYILDPGHGPLTALLWIKGGAPGQVILSQENGANWLMIDTEGRVATEFKLPGISMPFVSGAVITDGDWHRMGVVWDGTHRMLYVDGVQVLNESGIRFRPSQGGLHIGASSDLEPGTFWSGMIDDVRIYDRVVAP